MELIDNTKKRTERVCVVGVIPKSSQPAQAMSFLSELSRLAQTAGAEVVDTVYQKRDSFNSATLIGTGKLREIAQLVEEKEIDIILFDDELTGSQVKRIEAMVPGKVMDRSGIILDIFARNAQTAEAKSQVEVAQLEYIMPRLTRAWTHLCRQVGGIGTRGPGETQLEVDRRLIRKRISDLKKRLKKLEKTRKLQHDKRFDTFHAALVGYTNAGKSSLMNLLTKADILVADKLFATLDATTRKLNLGLHTNAVLSDTVGFIRKLPHNLIESFKSTLSVVEQSSIILNVVDVADKDFKKQMEVTAKVLNELNTSDIPRLTVFNKTDLLEPETLNLLKSQNPDAIFISVLGKSGIDPLIHRIKMYYDRHMQQFHAKLSSPPPDTW